tara:strand:- start:94297 stop:94428 length:132 start_codon:yes stop_codon:yes gene_type:complete
LHVLAILNFTCILECGSPATNSTTRVGSYLVPYIHLNISNQRR